MKKLRSIVAIPGDTMYLREQVAAAQATAARLGLELEVVSANMDAVGQGQQLLKYVQAREDLRPDAILLEPVSAAGLPRVAEAAVAAGIGWVVSNASVDYISALRGKAKAPVFFVSQDHVAIGRLQGQQIGATVTLRIKGQRQAHDTIPLPRGQEMIFAGRFPASAGMGMHCPCGGTLM